MLITLPTSCGIAVAQVPELRRRSRPACLLAVERATVPTGPSGLGKGRLRRPGSRPIRIPWLLLGAVGSEWACRPAAAGTGTGEPRLAALFRGGGSSLLAPARVLPTRRARLALMVQAGPAVLAMPGAPESPWLSQQRPLRAQASHSRRGCCAPPTAAQPAAQQPAAAQEPATTSACDPAAFAATGR
jgi:hypothetical protein